MTKQISFYSCQHWIWQFSIALMRNSICFFNWYLFFEYWVSPNYYLMKVGKIPQRQKSIIISLYYLYINIYVMKICIFSFTCVSFLNLCTKFPSFGHFCSVYKDISAQTLRYYVWNLQGNSRLYHIWSSLNVMYVCAYVYAYVCVYIHAMYIYFCVYY